MKSVTIKIGDYEVEVLEKIFENDFKKHLNHHDLQISK